MKTYRTILFVTFCLLALTACTITGREPAAGGQPITLPTAAPTTDGQPPATPAVPTPETRPAATPTTAPTATNSPSPTADNTVQPTDVAYIHALGDVNIRSGPGTSYTIVGWVAAGQIASVTGVNSAGSWWRVVCPTGTAGDCWVTADRRFTQPTTPPVVQPPPSTPTPVAVFPTQVGYVQALKDLNIRSGPGTSYRVVGWVAAGQTARVTGVNGTSTWWRVLCPDGSTGDCWVTADAGLSQPATAPGAGPTAVPPTAVAVLPTDVGYVQAQSDVNIRSGPGSNYAVIGWLAAGQTAQVTGISSDGGWWRVICPDNTVGSCWVTASSRFTRPAAPPAATCQDAATFVADVTIPDNSQVAPNTGFIKTWRVRNSGTCTWDSRYALVHAGGDLLGAIASGFPLPGTVAPGQHVDLSLSLVSPGNAGSYQSNWTLSSPQGGRFGVGRSSSPLWAKITVPGAPPAARTTINGLVYQDGNQNGFYDAGETTVPGREVVLSAGNSCQAATLPTATTISGTNGSYTFSGNLNGSYCLGVRGTNGLIEDVVTLTVSAGQTVNNVFLRAAGTAAAISGWIFSDYCDLQNGTYAGHCVADGSGEVRANGVYDPGESGIPGVTVQLLGGHCPSGAPQVASAVTDSQGRYHFPGLALGNYCITIAPGHPANVPVLLPGRFTLPALDQGFLNFTLTDPRQTPFADFGWDFQMK